jgi:carbon-monoxide dehydrogenase medium subunit
MKPSRFKYLRPSSLEETVTALRDHSPGAKLLSGGQSLVPLMNFRLVQPDVLIDIGRLEELTGITESEDRKLNVGANVCHHEIATWGRADPLGVLMSTAARHIGHLPIRERGTFGGSLAHADPAAEWCMVAVLLEADIIVSSVDGERAIPATDFFESAFATNLLPEEVLTRVRIEVLPPQTRTGFSEFARRAGDFALVAASFMAEMDGDVIAEARIALGGVSDVPVRCLEAEQFLVGEEPTVEVIQAVAEAAASNVEPYADIHGSSEYRRDLVRALVGRMVAHEFGVQLVGR